MVVVAEAGRLGSRPLALNRNGAVCRRLPVCRPQAHFSQLLEHEYPLIPLKDWVEAHDRRLSGMCGQRTMDVRVELDWGARDIGAHIAGRCVELEWFAAGKFLAKTTERSPCRERVCE